MLFRSVAFVVSGGVEGGGVRSGGALELGEKGRLGLIAIVEHEGLELFGAGRDKNDPKT